MSRRKRGWMRARFKAHKVCRVRRVFLVRLVLLALRGRRVYPARIPPFPALLGLRVTQVLRVLRVYPVRTVLLVLMVQQVRLVLPARQRCLLTPITHLCWALTGLSTPRLLRVWKRWPS